MEHNDELLDDLINIAQHETIPFAKNPDQNVSNRSDDELYDENSDENESDYGEDEDEEDEQKEEAFIDQMLEKPMDILNEKEELNYYTYNKIQIKNIYWRGCQDTILPEGWVQVTHSCGLPLFLNRQTRVCSLSRPYFIGQASARKHEIPLSSIPCFAYKKRKEMIDQQIKEHNNLKQQKQQANKCPFSNQTPTSNETKSDHPNDDEVKNKENDQVESRDAKAPEHLKELNLNKKVVVSIQSNEEKQKENLLTAEQVHEYCKKLFEFDVIKVKKFKTWGDRKKFIRKAKQKKFPENAKMLKIQTKNNKGINKELNINMTNKTPLSILYEYSNQVYKLNPRFEILEKENPKDPFLAICYINEKVCGRGNGNSKKAAKNAAAEAALCVLIPEFKSQSADGKKDNEEMYSFFDGYSVDHTHVYLLSQKLGAPMPYDVLLTCLKYNFALNMSRSRKQFIEEEIKPIKYRNCLYRMKLAQYEVEVNCTKKKEGRQLAAQKILKEMHPHIQTWGSMLRLYDSKLLETFQNDEQKEAKEELTESSQQASTAELAHKAKPNKELLDKLKEEMRKLKNKKADALLFRNENQCQETLLTVPPLLLSKEQEEHFGASESKSELDDQAFINDDSKIKLSGFETNDNSSKKRKLSGNCSNDRKDASSNLMKCKDSKRILSDTSSSTSSSQKSEESDDENDSFRRFNSDEQDSDSESD